MADLLKAYEQMNAATEEEVKVAAVEEEENAAELERVEILTKYAEAADTLLTEEYGEDYEEDDVIKLAGYMLDYDIEQEEIMEKVAEFDQAGRIMARAHWDEIQKLAAEEEVEEKEEE